MNLTKDAWLKLQNMHTVLQNAINARQYHTEQLISKIPDIQSLLRVVILNTIAGVNL
jgi:hypothetical protein